MASMFPSGMECLAVATFIIGVLFLFKGSDILVEGTVKTAAKLGISTIIISVLLVGFGTSAPEFAISVGAAVSKNSDISLGNIIGSCIANLFLVLGISAVIKPIKIEKGIIKRELPITIAATGVLVLASLFFLLDDYHLVGGILFIVLFVVFVWFFIRCAKKERQIDAFKSGDSLRNSVFIILGIAGVVVGAWLLIQSSITIAEIFGVPQYIIAVSIVAVGTSLPELTVSAMASFKGESDIAVGNVLGSNVFNILLILGFAAIFIPLSAYDSMLDITILLAVTLLMLPILHTGRTITRVEGVGMLFIYALFMIYVFLI